VRGWGVILLVVMMMNESGVDVGRNMIPYACRSIRFETMVSC